MNTEQLIHEVEILVPDLQKQQKKGTVKQRTIGEYQGKVHVSDDFDELLGDDFWLGN